MYNGDKGERFFFVKKKQKTFLTLGNGRSHIPAPD
jgi:hypothetical protein